MERANTRTVTTNPHRQVRELSLVYIAIGSLLDRMQMVRYLATKVCLNKNAILFVL